MAELLHKADSRFAEFEVWHLCDGSISIDIEYEFQGVHGFELTEGDEKALLKILQERENERNKLT